MGNTGSEQRSSTADRTVWVVAEVYYPDEVATAHYLTLIAEELGKERRVKVICAQPSYSNRSDKVAKCEVRNGVQIFRVWSTRLDKYRVVTRIINFLTVTISLFAEAAVRCRRGDVILAGTNPPVLAFAMAPLCWLYGMKCVLKVEDVYPDAMIIAGMIHRGGVMALALEKANRWLYRRVDRVCVLGRDMETAAKRKAYPVKTCIDYIPNWSDDMDIRPIPKDENKFILEYNLRGKFVIGFVGNMGPLQGIPHLVECMTACREFSDVHFAFVGSGKMSEWLSSQVAARGLKNVTLAGQMPRARQQEFLNALDIGIVSLVAGMSGVGVPSRFYNLLAAGKPVLACLDADHEIALAVREEQIGWVVKPGSVEEFAATIEGAKSDRLKLKEIGLRSRRAAETTYSRQNVLDRYSMVFRDVCDESS